MNKNENEKYKKAINRMNEQFKKSGLKFSSPCGFENYKKKIYNK